MALISKSIRSAVENFIDDYTSSRLARLSAATGNYVIKFVNSEWAAAYEKHSPLYISGSPLLTWGNATYVTPLVFPLSSALYGRIGLVTDYDPMGWRIFDATRPAAQAAYVNWIRAQPASFKLLALTVHSTHANQVLRNQFREDFQIDCVLFNPDQEADLHTDMGRHVWMAVTDWSSVRGRMPYKITNSGPSARLTNARFTVLIDEDFALLEEKSGLPIQKAARRIEQITEKISPYAPIEVAGARTDPTLPIKVIDLYQKGGYVHIFINP